MKILPPRPSIQVDAQGVSPQDPRTFQTDLCSLALFCRGNMMEQPFGGCFDFPWGYGSPPWAQDLRAIATEKWLPSKCWQAMCNSPHAGGWKSYLPQRKERHPQRVCFQASAWQQVFEFSDVRPPGLLRGPQFQSQGLVSPYIVSETCKHIPRSAWSCPWGSRLRECVWGGRVPCCGHLVEGNLHLQRATSKVWRATPLLQKPLGVWEEGKASTESVYLRSYGEKTLCIQLDTGSGGQNSHFSSGEP